MYFSLGPKERKEDFFNFEREYFELKNSIERHRLIVIKGLRRTGKTSLIKILFNEIKHPKIFIDTREITELTPRGVNSFLREIFLDYLKREKILKAILSYIESIEFGVKITLKKERPILSRLLREIDEELGKRKEKMVIFIDEAQVLKEVGFDRFLAFIYDNLKNFVVVLAGSEIGLLDELIGVESGAPLYGRVKKIIEIERLSKENSILLMKEGFRQARKKVRAEEIEECIERLDGVIGWLTMYGYYALEEGHESALNKTIKEGAKIVASELNKFLSKREIARERYITILSILSHGPQTWSRIKEGLELKEKKRISEGRFSSLISTLLDYGFIIKVDGEYKLADPLISEALKLL
jgi:AAA+ ATPase superfamily predicted ATPase